MKRKKVILLAILGIVVMVGVFLVVKYKTPNIVDQDVHATGHDHVDIAAFDDDKIIFPEKNWVLYDQPENLGWNNPLLDSVGTIAEQLETSALMVIHNGVLIYDWGATDEKYLTQSLRKGLLNSLYGVSWDKGVIDLNQTLKELGIEESPPLTKTEKQVTIEQLLQSTSGIYRSGLYELGAWKRERPEPGTHKPGEKWYYNNWGFNVLGTIIEKQTQSDIGSLFADHIATPLQMNDFNKGDVSYITEDMIAERIMGNHSQHSAYMFSISARDLARFGLLYLNNGVWKNDTILSSEWISKTFTPVNIEQYYTLKFGYLWWMFQDGTIYIDQDLGFEDDIYFTSGNRGHALFVIPYLNLVVVHRVYAKGTSSWDQIRRGMFKNYAEVDDDDVYRMLDLIRQAHPYYNKG